MSSSILDQYEQDHFPVIDLLKSRGSIAPETFTQDLPFFSFTSDLLLQQIAELFQSRRDVTNYHAALHSLLGHLSDTVTSAIPQNTVSTQSMSFAQIVLYKVIRCPNQNCRGNPRGIVTHNNYTDAEYECPFYHHNKDRRRFVISAYLGEEFEYKANYFDDRRPTGHRAEYSQNYFESMFHPLYYKMFRCKRSGCNGHEFCPAFHNEEERLEWDRIFREFMGKDRVSYVKDKQKFYESGSASKLSKNFKDSFEDVQRRSNDEKSPETSGDDSSEWKSIKNNFKMKTKKEKWQPLRNERTMQSFGSIRAN